jgi:aspartyl-tRNA(Asn)/glutamyl-tRNA(Gln) amidotransferase subunit C
MAKISREEIIKIAQISQIAINDDEIEAFKQQIDSILTYAARVQEIAADSKEVSYQMENVFRSDEVIKTDAQPLLAQAPEHEEGYFVVPRILESN